MTEKVQWIEWEAGWPQRTGSSIQEAQEESEIEWGYTTSKPTLVTHFLQ